MSDKHTAPAVSQEAGQARELPPLPEPWITHLSIKDPAARHHYAEDQMLDYARAAIAQAAPGVPHDYVLMPRRLTAKNGAKAALISEFYEEISVICNECGNDDSIECDACEGVGVVTQRVTVGWDTIKDIYVKAVEVLAAAPSAPADQPELDYIEWDATGKLVGADVIVNGERVTLVRQPAPAVPDGWTLVPTDLNSVVSMGWVYLDKAREESPFKEWAFSPAGFIAAIAAQSKAGAA